MSGGILPILTNVNPTPLWDTAGGSNAPDGKISSLYGYDQYTIYSSTFSDDSLTFTFANNYVEQQFLSDGSNYSRITNATDGLLLESFYISTGIPLVAGTRDITLLTFNNLTGQQQQAGLDAATSSFFVSCVNGIVSETATMSNLNLSVLDLDGQIVTADPTDLLLNGVPIATSANISSLSEWAYDPAISTIQGNNNDLIGIRAGFFSSITANGIVAENLTVISTIQNYNYISTQQVQTEIVSSLAVNASTINGYTVDQLRSTTQDLVVSSLTAASFVSTAAVVASTFNGYTVGDFLSTSASQYDPNPLFSTIVININGFISTPDLEVSSINGHEFNQNTVIISTVNTDSLNAIQISSLVGDISLQLVSTVQFRPTFDIDFNFDLAPIGEGIKSGLTRIGVGIGAGLTALGTGIAAAALGRKQTTNIYNNSSNFELINGTTQLQFSTFNYEVSSIYRFVSSSGSPDLVPGQEIFVSTIIPAGTTVVRSMSDPLNLLDPSTFTSTLQSFGQWVEVPNSGISTFSNLLVLNNTSTQTLNVDYINGYTGNTVAFGNPLNGNNIYFDTTLASGGLQIDSFPPGNSFLNVDKVAIDSIEAKTNPFITINANVERLIGSNTNFLTSTVQIGPSTILTAENDFPGLAVRQVDDSSIAQVNASAFVVGDPDDTFQGAYTYLPTFDRAAVLNSSLVTKYVAYLDDLQDIQNNSISTLALRAGTGLITAASVSSLVITGLPNSTITIGTVPTAGVQLQPAGRAIWSGQDFDLGQNDLWAQQVRVGANATGVTAELVLYQPDNGTKAYSVQSGDRTIRIGSSALGGIQTNPGYVIDTFVNPIIASTINNNLNLMAFFPSTNSSTIGVSTMTVIPNYLLSAYASTSQTVTAANTPTPLNHNATTVNVGGFTVLGSTITMPASGIYEVGVTIQLDKDGGGTNFADFWLRKNGVDIPNTSRQTVVAGTNGETLGSVSIFQDILANDQLSIVLASDDATMRAAYFQSTVTTPYTRPAVPAILTNIKKIG